MKMDAQKVETQSNMAVQVSEKIYEKRIKFREWHHYKATEKENSELCSQKFQRILLFALFSEYAVTKRKPRKQ